MPPRAWEDDRCPWDDPEFSLHFARCGALGPGRARQEAAFLAGYLPPGALALDLGCGAGRTARALARRGARVLGIDLGPGAIRLARQRSRGEGCRFREGDMLTETYPEAPFGMAYCVDGGLAGLRPAAAARALRRLAPALAPGAALVLECPSEAMAEALDLRQDWYVDHESPAGVFPQLVLTEDFYLREQAAYVHRAFAVDLAGGAIHRLSQTYALYDEASMSALLEQAGFQVESFHGEMGPDAYAAEESQRLVVVARRP